MLRVRRLPVTNFHDSDNDVDSAPKVILSYRGRLEKLRSDNDIHSDPKVILEKGDHIMIFIVTQSYSLLNYSPLLKEITRKTRKTVDMAMVMAKKSPKQVAKPITVFGSKANTNNRGFCNGCLTFVINPR